MKSTLEPLTLINHSNLRWRGKEGREGKGGEGGGGREMRVV